MEVSFFHISDLCIQIYYLNVYTTSMNERKGHWTLFCLNVVKWSTKQPNLLISFYSIWRLLIPITSFISRNVFYPRCLSDAHSPNLLSAFQLLWVVWYSHSIVLLHVMLSYLLSPPCGPPSSVTTLLSRREFKTFCTSYSA